ncbi:MAG: M1 family metallopeptidase, partial [Bacteroidota bacterium]|nr:M1 family metallopeptidase [Bacteroidota bacterium]
MSFVKNSLKNIVYISLLILFFVDLVKAQDAFSFEKGRIRTPAGNTKALLQPQKVYDQLTKYDVNYYKLNLNVSNANTYISGNAIIGLTVLSALDTLWVELIDSVNASTYMVVDSAFINGNKFQYVHHDSLLSIPINTQQPGAKITLQVYYHGNGGPDALSNYGYSGEYYTTTWSEPQSSKTWFPCKQVLDDKADSTEMVITTESTNKVGSNGLLISATNLPDSKIRYVWKSKHPIAYYLISFAAGPYIEYNVYAKIDGLADSVLVQNYLFNNAQLLPLHKAAIEKVKLCINLYSRLFGPFPFRDEKYGHCVYSWPWGAMENQTMTTIGYEYLDTTANLYAGMAYYFGAPHELAHSWFGDYVTCGTWNDIWLNEGFASYCEYIALQEIDSPINAGKWIDEAKATTMSSPGGSVYNLGYLSQYDGYRINYKKGALLLHMIRYELNNDSLFYDILKTYVARYANKTAIGLDFKAVLEEKSGKDFTDFFNQWYFGEGYPVFNISGVRNSDSLVITSQQTKSISTAPLFKMPFMLQLKYAGGDTTLNLYQMHVTERFIIPFKKKVTSIVFDPKNWLLANAYTRVTDVEESEPAKEITFGLSQNYP